MNPSPTASNTPATTSRKFAVVVVIAALTAAVSGYFMGLLQAGGRELAQPAARVPSEPRAADAPPPAPNYSDLARREAQPNRSWSSGIAALEAPPPFTERSPAVAPAELARIARVRGERRAFNGAPPIIPHTVDQSAAASCLACHGSPTRIDGRDVPLMSHALHSQCLQCHAATVGGPPGTGRTELVSLPAGAAGNTFSGALPPRAGTRAFPGAPPTLPHTTHMRQNCLSCHGPGGSSLIKTSHPHQQNCLQCHATDARRDGVPSAGLPPRLVLHEPGNP